MTKKQTKKIALIIISGIIFVFINIINFLFRNTSIKNTKIYIICLLTAYILDYLIISFQVLKKAFKEILKGQIFDENFLMAIASLGAIILALYTKSGDFNEAIAVILFYQVGELFESIAVGKSRKNITELMNIRPDYANIESNGKIEKVSPEEVQVGTIITVQPGERIPLDGKIIFGNANIETSALTGESTPRKVVTGNDVVSGCICLDSILKIQTTKAFEESTVSKIMTLVEESSSRKSKSENFITKFAKYYTPAVCGAAMALAIIPPLLSILTKTNSNFSVWIYRALTFLVISCPCALVISIPLSFFAGIGGASKEGILVKGSNFLEALANVETIVFDKTGTLTKGTFEVSNIYITSSYTQDQVVEYATYAECFSSHPISKSLQAYYAKDIDRTKVEDSEEIAGHGVKAKVFGKTVVCGNEKLMQMLNLKTQINNEIESNSGTIIHIAIENEYAGCITINDCIKKDSKDAIEQLKKIGVKKTIMLTGDNKLTAKSVAQKLNLDEYYAELMPQDKVTILENILQKKFDNSNKVIFVGDGINDAPVLSRADIGIAMGAMGSDAAIEAADVVLMDDNPLKIVKGIKVSRKCLSIVWQNIIFALGIKAICLILGAFGFANMWFAIFADVGVMILAVLNAIRALKCK